MTELSRLDDAALLQAHRNGDADAFGELFGRHRDRLWAVALRTTGNPEDAADALQDGMIAAFRRADGFRGDAKVSTWLHRIVVNACLDRLRRNRVRAAAPLPETETEFGQSDRAGPAPAPVDPAEEAVAADRRRRILAALGELGPDQRAAIVLVDMEGYSVEEAARVLDCRPGTVKSRCARGRHKLAAILGASLGSGTESGDSASHLSEAGNGPPPGEKPKGVQA